MGKVSSLKGPPRASETSMGMLHKLNMDTLQTFLKTKPGHAKTEKTRDVQRKKGEGKTPLQLKYSTTEA